MGTCQSCCTGENTEDYVLAHKSHKSGRDLPSSSLDTKGSDGPKHAIFELLSPTYTEATTPASTCTLITPKDGPLSLSMISASSTSSGRRSGKSATLITPKDGPLSLSMISSSSISSGQRSGKNVELGRRRASRFSFDTPAQIDETLEEETPSPNASSDEEDSSEVDGVVSTAHFACIKEPSQEMTILNPPLVAPPKGQADLLWQMAKTRGSVNDCMVREFNRFKRQASYAEKRAALEEQQVKQRKKKEKTVDRLEDIKSYSSLWDQFVELEKLSTSVDQQQKSNTSKRVDDEGECVGYPAKKIVRNASNQKQRNKKWKMLRTGKEDDKTSCQKTTVSLLSEFGMESQRILQEARCTTTQTISSEEKSKPGTKDFGSILEESSNDCAPVHVVNTPCLSPPRLEVITNESKSTITAYTRLDSMTAASLTDIEVLFDKRDDDASGITHEDFDNDSWLQRRARTSRFHPREEDMSSCVSYGGEIPTRLRTKRNLFRNISHGVGQLSELDENVGLNSSTRTQSTLGNRIAHVERKVQAFQATRGASQHTNTESTESLRVVGVASDDDDKNDERQSPVSCEVASVFNMHTEQDRTQLASDDLEPTKLEQMFDSSSDIISPGNVREKIVLRNATKCQRQSSSSHQDPCPSKDISLMSTEEFLSMSVHGHAWVQVSRCPVNGSYRYQESSGDERCQARDTGVSSTPNASEIAERVRDIADKFRDNDTYIVDAHEMFLQNGSLDSEEFGDDVQGRLFSA